MVSNDPAYRYAVVRNCSSVGEGGRRWWAKEEVASVVRGKLKKRAMGGSPSVQASNVFQVEQT